MKRQPRRGLTLFQLLILVVLLLFLLGLLIPALARVRSAAGRAGSANNLKQIALACHNYHDVNGTLPSGVDDNHFSAAAYLLPYIEQDNLYKSIDFKKECDATENAKARDALIKIFVSNLDPLPPGGERGMMNYFFNAGSKNSLDDNDGVFFHNSKLQLAKIPDGTSNTLLACESLRGDGGQKPVDMHRQHVALEAKALKDLKEESGVEEWKDGKNIAGNRGGHWIDGRFLQSTFTMTRPINSDKPDVDCGGKGGLSGLRSINQVFNVGMCDGSVRAIRTTVAFDTLKALSTSNGGEVIPDF
jgi:hypothetical protein